MMEKFVQSLTSNGTATLVLDRPDFHNALNKDFTREIMETMMNFQKSKEVRVIIISSNGKTFCAGADLEWMQKTLTYTKNKNLQEAKLLAKMYRTIRESPKPVIARIQGAAYGGGVGLVAASDIAVALNTARFCLSEVKLGIIPSIIAPYLLEKTSAGTFSRYALTAESFDAQEAKRIGLVSEVANSMEEMDQFILKISQTLKNNAPLALAASKKLIRDLKSSAWDKFELLTTKRIAEIRVSPEGQEGLRAFLEKRKPSWIS